MMTLNITVPSKTFLLGEYAVLKGAPALILTTEKYFNLIVNSSNTNKLMVNGIHPDSPSGKLIKKHEFFYKNFDLKFEDPYQGMGGLGASSAQFLMLYALYKFENNDPIGSESLLKDYLEMSWNGQGIAPSGADIIAQLHGGVCCYQKSENKVQVFQWPFHHLNYFLLHTGNKLATHHHLAQLKQFNAEKLIDISYKSIESFRQENDVLFIQTIQNYAHALREENLVAEKTLTLCQMLLQNPDILAVKGCGALGSDIIFGLFEKIKNDSVLAYLEKNYLKIIAYGDSTAEGLRIDYVAK